MARAMARAAATASPSALLLLGMFAASAAAPGELMLPDISTLSLDSIYLLPLAGEKCGEGNPMYYGIVTPSAINTTTKVWVESMGGAICFDEHSCADKEFNVWLDLLKIVKRYVPSSAVPGGSVDALYALLTSGLPIPLSMFRELEVSYFPNGAGGALEGEVGFFFPSCTGDAGLGNHEVTYRGDQVTHHSGGASYMLLMRAVQQARPDLERMTLIGASGSAVSRVAWASTAADMFPTAEVRVVADSAMHVLPGTEVFKYFWSEVQWSPNPGGRHDLAQLYAPGMVSLPTFDWRSLSAISDMLRQYAGRVKLLYIACNNDEVVKGDRNSLSAYANFTAPTSVEEEMWDFIQRLVRDAPAGSAFSYISQGTCHHQTRNGFVPAINASDSSDPGPKRFTEAFLKGEPLDTAHVWCCGKAPPEPAAMEETSSAASMARSLVASAVAAVSVGISRHGLNH